MGAIVPVSAMNKMEIRGMNIILLVSMGVIAAGVVIVYTNKHAHANWYHHSSEG
jgi:glucose uptake protein GlcU